MCWSESVKVKMQHTAHMQQWWTLYVCLDHSVFHISSWYKCYGWIFKRNTEWRSSCKLYMTDVHICISNLQSSIYWAIAAIQQHVFHSQLGIYLYPDLLGKHDIRIYNFVRKIVIVIWVWYQKKLFFFFEHNLTPSGKKTVTIVQVVTAS